MFTELFAFLKQGRSVCLVAALLLQAMLILYYPTLPVWLGLSMALAVPLLASLHGALLARSVLEQQVADLVKEIDKVP